MVPTALRLATWTAQRCDVPVTAPTQIPMGQGARLDFGSWSDGGASNHVITVSQNYAVATASYKTFYHAERQLESGERVRV